ncbi:MAG: hypothetical protein ACJAY5_001591 [Actinomycetes bacterium]|jgi:hypothetical protein
MSRYAVGKELASPMLMRMRAAVLVPTPGTEVRTWERG